MALEMVVAVYFSTHNIGYCKHYNVRFGVVCMVYCAQSVEL